MGIGKYFDITEENIKNEGITAIVNIRETFRERDKKISSLKKLKYIYFPIWDGADYDNNIITEEDIIKEVKTKTLEIVEKIYNLLNSGYKVVVHCTGGIDRSPFVVATLLIKLGKVSNYGEAYAMIKKVRPFVVEHYEWSEGLDV